MVHGRLLARGSIGLLGQFQVVKQRRFASATQNILVYGANTDVGKTVACAAICHEALVRGHKVAYIKPVQTGSDTDAQAVHEHCARRGLAEALRLQTLFHYPSPESPASAAEKAGAIPPQDAEFRKAVLSALQAHGAPSGPDPTERDSCAPVANLALLETAGGPLSPGPNHTFQADIYAPLGLPCVLVGDPKLGGISATVCAYEALVSRKQTPKAILFIGSEGPHSNATAVQKALPDVPVISVPCTPPQQEPLTDWLAEPQVTKGMSALLEKVRMLQGPEVSGVEEHLRLDREHLWHPYTSMVKPGLVWPVRSASGCHIQLEDGQSLVDGMASWWCAIHGYNVPELNAAATRQLSQSSHVMFGGLTHRPATDLAKALLSCVPPGLSRIFLCDSGSVSVEVALKMALQYWATQGVQRKCRIATVQRGYHGDTFGAMAVCDPVRGMHGLFKHSLPQQLFAAEPTLARPGVDIADDGFSSMEELLRQNAEDVAAVIIEPVVQGAGGMRIYSPSYLVKLRNLCRELRILLIFDEIATGFGRTGKLFAAEHAQVTPDIMCVGKALTGGYCTLGATIASEDVARRVSGPDGKQPLMHGPTFMANPLACAIAAASIRLLLEGPWQSRVAAIEKQLELELRPLMKHPEVSDVRVLGAIGVVELRSPPKEPAKLQQALVRQGVWLRPFGQTIYTMPPYIISQQELGSITKAMSAVLEEGIELID